MPETNISSAEKGDFANTETKFSVDAVSTDGPGDQKETSYMNENWTQQLGYYKDIPELKSAIDAKATWTIGKGYEADPQTTFILDGIKGFGKDTFNTILENMVRTMHIGGDAYSEIVRDKDSNLINLKPLDPEVIKIIVNRQGIITRYEQTSKVKSLPKKFEPEQIFHLSRNRVADEIHGESIIDAVEEIVLMRNEAMADYKKLLHRNVFPVHKFSLDTDDPAKIAAFKAKQDAASEGGENMYIPKGAVEQELISVPGNSTLTPLPWIQLLNQQFFQVVGVPQIIVGGSNEITEATAKILYLAFEQTIEEDQLYLEEETGMQLGMKIELEFPASLENELLSDKAKSETTQAATPEDTTVQGVPLNAAG